MKKRYGLKLFGVLLFVGTCFYIYQNWLVFHDKLDIELRDINYSQVKLDVKPIQYKFENPIWLIKTETPVVAFRILFKNEGNRAFQTKKGILEILVQCLKEGAGNRNAAEFKKVLSDNSITLNIENTEDDIIITGVCLKKHFGLVCDLVCDVCSKAQLNDKKIEILKQSVSACLMQMKFNPEFLANERLNNLIYDKNHPYYFSSDEILKMIPEYSKQDIDDAYSIIFNPADAEITIAGDFSEKEIVVFANKIFKSIENKKKHKFEKAIQKDKICKKNIIDHVELNNPQTTVVFALPGIKQNAPEFFALRFANIAFGSSGFNSRLLKNIRDENGLCYSLITDMNNLDLQSYISGKIYTRPENVKKVIQRIKEECKKFCEKGITEEELTLFKTYIFANNVLDTTGETLSFVTRCRDDGINTENIDNYLNNFYNLTVSDVNNAIKKVFDPNNLVIVDCGKCVVEEVQSNKEKSHD